MPGRAYSQLYSQPEWMNVCTYSMNVSTYIINELIEYLAARQYLFECVWMYIYIRCAYVCKHVCMCGYLPLQSDWVLHMGCDAIRHIVRRLQHRRSLVKKLVHLHPYILYIYIHTVLQIIYVCMFIHSMWRCMYLCTYLRIYVYFRIEYLRCIINVCMFMWPVWDVFPVLIVIAFWCLRWRELWKSATGLCRPSSQSIRWLIAHNWLIPYIHTYMHAVRESQTLKIIVDAHHTYM